MDNLSPKHYKIDGRKECWDEMEELFGVEALKIFCKLNVYKYQYRHELKNGSEDLEKAKVYYQKFLDLGGKIDEWF